MKAFHTFTPLLRLLLPLLFPSIISAQKLSVESMKLSEGDRTATLEENLHQDLNGDLGGLVKVYLAAPGAQFLGPSVLETKNDKVNEHWVFMAKDAFILQVGIPGYLPLDINFRDYGIEGIESCRTYVLNITLPQPSNIMTNTNPSAFSNASFPEKEVFTVNGVSFTMVRVEGGGFVWRYTKQRDDNPWKLEKVEQEVCPSTFWIGETEVTQALWQAVMGSNPSEHKDNPNNPAESFTKEECKEFINKLNALTGKKFRLPQEVEWVYAASGGNKSKHFKYSGSNNVDEVAWYWKNSGDKRLPGKWDFHKLDGSNKTHPVKSKMPNELGIYDMSGNVSEWCRDNKGIINKGDDYEKPITQSFDGRSVSLSNRCCQSGIRLALDSEGR